MLPTRVTRRNFEAQRGPGWWSEYCFLVVSYVLRVGYIICAEKLYPVKLVFLFSALILYPSGPWLRRESFLLAHDTRNEESPSRFIFFCRSDRPTVHRPPTRTSWRQLTIPCSAGFMLQRQLCYIIPGIFCMWMKGFPPGTDLLCPLIEGFRKLSM